MVWTNLCKPILVFLRHSRMAHTFYCNKYNQTVHQNISNTLRLHPYLFPKNQTNKSHNKESGGFPSNWFGSLFTNISFFKSICSFVGFFLWLYYVVKNLNHSCYCHNKAKLWTRHPIHSLIQSSTTFTKSSAIGVKIGSSFSSSQSCK